MMTPELNARIVEMELTNRRPAPVHKRSRPTQTKERSDKPMFHYTLRYARYALTTLAHVGFGLFMN